MARFDEDFAQPKNKCDIIVQNEDGGSAWSGGHLAPAARLDGRTLGVREPAVRNSW